MVVGIHGARYGKFNAFLERYEKILSYNGIQSIRLDASDESFWDDVQTVNLFIYRWQHYHDDQQLGKTIIPVIEREMKIPCYPNMATCWHYDDKVRQYYILSRHGYPIIKSWIFWSKEAALRWANNSAEFPVVFKLKGGASSSNVILVNDARTANKIIKIMFSKGVISGRLPVASSTYWKDFSLYKKIHKLGGDVLRKARGEDLNPYWQIDKNYAYFQEYMPSNEYDTRVTIIGDRAFAFRRMNRKNDFRSSGSGMLSYDPEKIDQRFIETAFGISKEMGYQCMAYDFLYGHDNEIKFCEMSYDFVDVAVFHCPGHWNSALEWKEGKLWPQYCQLVDLLGMPDLKQPNIECPLPDSITVV